VARHDFDAVQSRLGEAARRAAVTGDEIPHLGARHGAGHQMESLIGRVRGRECRGDGAVRARQNLAPGMEELAEQAAIEAVNRARQARIAGNAVVRVRAERGGVVERAFVDARDLDDDERRPAPRAGLVIGDERVVHRALRQRGVVAARKNPVLEREAGEGEGREQVRKARGHRG